MEIAGNKLKEEVGIMNRMKVIKDCIILFIIFSVVAIMNKGQHYFSIPEQEKMIDTQTNLFTICSVFAGFSFSILGLIMGVFSEKVIEKLKGTTLIQRKCNCIMQSIIYFCTSGFISLIFILGFNIYLEGIIYKGEIVNGVLYINGIGFMLWGMIYFIAAVKNLLLIIEKIYGFNNETYIERERQYHATRSKIIQKRESMEEDKE